MSDANTLMIGTMRSRNVYRGIEGLGNSALISPPRASKEEHARCSPKSSVFSKECSQFDKAEHSTITISTYATTRFTPFTSIFANTTSTKPIVQYGEHN